MASSSGTTSGEDLKDERKRKRMESNRESARRSRMKKQKHLDDLMAQISQISKDNNQILNSINVTTEVYLKVEAENSILRAQMMELTQRLQSLNEILNYVNSSSAATNAGGGGGGSCMFEAEEFYHGDGFLNNSWNFVGANQLQPPVMASAEMFGYY